jgi:hypothetical protein
MVVMSRYNKMVSGKLMKRFFVRAKGMRLVLSIMPFISEISHWVNRPVHLNKMGKGLTTITKISAYKIIPDSGTIKKLVNRKRLGN